MILRVLRCRRARVVRQYAQQRAHWEACEIDRTAASLAESCPRPVLRLELLVDRQDDPARLNGSGLFVVNPPWTLAAEANILLPALADRLARAGYGAFRCEELPTRAA